MSIAFLGLGRMGLAMAGRLLDAGHDLTVWNRTAARADPLVARGARRAATPAEAARGNDVVVTMLADADAVSATLLGDAGAFAGLAAGGLAIDMSTIGPTVARIVADEAGRRSLRFLDAPVSGSVGAAERGELVVMAGGDAAAFASALPLLRTLSKSQVHVGASGAGAAAKLAVNAVVAITNEAIGEAIALGRALGVESEALYDVLEQGAVGSPFVHYKREAFLHPDAAPPAFTIGLMQKDVRLAGELAADASLALPALAAAAAMIDAAVAAGLADGDMARVLDLLRPAPR
jgi:3-hydroxyisobutyrate dehydrogenase